VLHAAAGSCTPGEPRGGPPLTWATTPGTCPSFPGATLFPALPLSSGTAPHRPVELLVYDPAGRIRLQLGGPAPGPRPRDGRPRTPKPGRAVGDHAPGRPPPSHLPLLGCQSSFGLAYPRVDAGRYLAGSWRPSRGFLLLALIVLLAVVARTDGARPPKPHPPLAVCRVRRRFTLRLFVAFVAAAIIRWPCWRSWCAASWRAACCGSPRPGPRTGLRRPQGGGGLRLLPAGRSGGPAAGDGPSLVWVSSLIRNDLDVFGRGRSSARASASSMPRACCWPACRERSSGAQPGPGALGPSHRAHRKLLDPSWSRCR